MDLWETVIVREIDRTDIAVAGATALCWSEGVLYDAAAGWAALAYAGARRARFARYSPMFDAVATSPAGDVFALVASTGTKGLLLGPDGGVIREINRSYYNADVHRYPVALFTLANGRTALVHCPREYNLLEVEDALTGEPLTATQGREPKDFCHSRLAVSASGRYLLSAGWVWQPADDLAVYDLPQGSGSPEHLDSWGDAVGIDGFVHREVSGACFIGDDVVLSTSAEDTDDVGDPDDLGWGMLARWSSAERRYLWRQHLGDTAGDLAPIGGNVLALYQHPRLYDGDTGQLLSEWPI
jgi:hypothetical protein